MIISPDRVLLSDGTWCVIESASPSDAKYVINYLKEVAKESPYMVRYIDEIGEGKKEISARIKQFQESPMRAALIADRENYILGMTTLCEVSSYRKARHRGCFSISVRKEFWGIGIGRALLTRLLIIASNMGYSQLELEVACENTKAVSLYLGMGFIIYGRRENAYYIEETGFLSEYLMYKEL